MLTSKWWTADCEECNCRDEDICLWGVWDKRLTKSDSHKPRHCEYVGQPSKRDEMTRRESRYVPGPLPPRVVQGKLC